MDEFEIEYEVVRSTARKRSTSLQVTELGEVVVKAPAHASLAMIDAFVRQNVDWIKDKLHETRHKASVKKKFVTGELLPYRGELYPMSVTVSSGRKRVKVDLVGEMFVVLVPTDVAGSRMRVKEIRAAMKRWFVQKARSVIEAQVASYALKVGREVASVRIKETSSRWGSCSSRGNVNFNWKLILAPPEILRYVVIHEVCHLVHQHHRNTFWDLVRKYDSEYPQHRLWLKRNGWKLEI